MFTGSQRRAATLGRRLGHNIRILQFCSVLNLGGVHTTLERLARVVVKLDVGGVDLGAATRGDGVLCPVYDEDRVGVRQGRGLDRWDRGHSVVDLDAVVAEPDAELAQAGDAGGQGTQQNNELEHVSN